jgi:hypothetical protein
MRAFRRDDPVIRLEQAVRWQIAERDRKDREEEAYRVRRLKTMTEEYAVRTPILRAAGERAEKPYQALLTSSEWARTVAVISIGKTVPITALDVPDEASLRGWALSFGATVVLTKRVHYMAPLATTVLKIEGSLSPTVSWWETGSSIPQEDGSPLISLSDRMAAYGTVLNLCLLLRRGRLLSVIQSAYLRRIRASRWSRFALGDP